MMNRVKVLWTVFTLLGLVIFGCSDRDTDTGTGPAQKETAPREGSVGKTEDGHDVLVFQEGELDDFLFDMNATVTPDEDVVCAAALSFRNLDENKIPLVGDIIASAPTKSAPNGFLYKVLEVSTKGGVTTVTARCASLEETIQEVKFEGSVELQFNEDDELIGALQKTTSGGWSLSKTFDLGSGDHLKAEASYTIWFNFALETEWFMLQYAKVTVSHLGHAGLSGRVSRQVNTRELLGKKFLGAITFWIGPVPVVFTTDVEANLRVTSKGEVDLLADYQLDLRGEYGAEYKRKSGWGLVNTTTATRTSDVEHHMNGNVRVGILFGLVARLYDVAGVGLDAGPAVDFSVDGRPAGGTYVFDNGFQHDYEYGQPKDAAILDFGVSIEARVNLSVLGYRLNHNFWDAYFSVAKLGMASFLPAFGVPLASQNDNDGITYGLSPPWIQTLNYPVRDYGVCAEIAGSGQCEAGGGIRKVIDPASKGSINLEFNNLEPGTYGIRPYVYTGKSTFYDKATVVNTTHSLEVLSSGCSEDFFCWAEAGQLTDIPLGTKVKITAKTQYGGVFLNWTVAGGTIDDSTAASTFVTVNSNTTVTANFRQKYQLNVMKRPNAAAGTVTPADVQYFYPGEKVKITATPADGYVFVNWTLGEIGKVDDQNADTTFVTMGDGGRTVVTANFALEPKYKITANPAPGGTIEVSRKTDIAAGTKVLIEAIPDTLYVFDRWEVTGGELADPAAKSTYVTVNGNTTVTAYFKPVYTITVNKSDSGNVTSDAPANGLVVAGTKVKIEAEPAFGYAFAEWSPGIESKVDNLSDSSTYITVNANTVVTARFKTKYVVKVPVPYLITGGRIIKPTNQTGIIAGTRIDIEAEPSTTYEFDRWEVTGGELADPAAKSTYVTVDANINADMTLTAYFKKVETPPENSFTYGGQSYRFVEMDGRIWMAENLNYQTDNSWCYDNVSSNCDKYGRLYSWDDAITACPDGWSLPDTSHWRRLVEFAGGESNAGQHLKAIEGWTHSTGDYAPKDTHGFSAKSAGSRNPDGNFVSIGAFGGWWTATEWLPGDSSAPAFFRYMSQDNKVYEISTNGFKSNGFSVRCVKND